MKQFVVQLEDKDAVAFETFAQSTGYTPEELIIKAIKKIAEVTQPSQIRGASVAQLSPSTKEFARQLRKSSERARKVP